MVPMSEAEFATCLREPAAVIRHRGRHWRQSYPGFFEPIYPMARLSVDEATRPARLCWANHTMLADDALELANATHPMHLLADLSSFGPRALSSNGRYHLRHS